MSKKLRRILIIICTLVFLACGGYVVKTKLPYWINEINNRKAADEYTEKNDPIGPSSSVDDSIFDSKLIAPLKVDFKALKAVNNDVIGWIYCEDTAINYPVLQGETDESYIHTNYKGESNFAGAIFAEAQNLRDFKDNNTILYGHNMYDGSMFACLSNWQVQDFMDKHPIIWILTPEQDYCVEVFSAYITHANNLDVYAIYRGTGSELSSYIKRVRSYSYVSSSIELDESGKYILLSTCTNAEGDLRSVVHGLMVPADSAAGIMKE